MKLSQKLLLALLATPLGAMAQGAVEINHKVILGLHEEARIKELGLDIEAKLDTGAVSASLSAYDIQPVMRDGEEWVRFRLGVADDAGWRELPLDDTVRIRRRIADMDGDLTQTATSRPVVRLTVCVGEREVPMRVNLTDRRNFSYALLLGAEGLRDLRSLVDPAQAFSSGSPRCTVTLANLDNEHGEEEDR